MSVLANDPQLQAFMRTKARRVNEIKAEQVRQLAQLQSNREYRALGLRQDRDLALRGVNEDYLDRGLYRSGGRIQDRGDVQQAYLYDLTGSELDYTNRASDVRARSAQEQTALFDQQSIMEAAAIDRENQRRLEEARYQRQLEEAKYARQQFEKQLQFQKDEAARAKAAAASSAQSRYTPGFVADTYRSSGTTTTYRPPARTADPGIPSHSSSYPGLPSRRKAPTRGTNSRIY